ncbi:MAG: 23S rRNA (pseudouridine(1915)-N(3))-methyltransferase RlmH [Bdellovibrionales bacterium]|jgi:23S rRNA (pseudouridine1915-N3)-methyltransferase|nr:23S rRNA (pseudouridine(1915)-N(3))-methyltransferase RlmH [Bdellovibrionales bacterium]MBT3526905.1 23S rRNA (pseudouridine(1915)-N(3))-methyltransferase RlmH [Bdellovibrionales bacterium]MBT7669647.1 23S rRNA (pseudouridine(1915)-N(3))-methyltransferase RlmH [Bdellovibrionales bacterium]MBT7767286.1 23S rRNA (pseudouridine(1915)-N(3))-methyltransferase RlmH [Bdellovibrionales bacterium]
MRKLEIVAVGKGERELLTIENHYLKQIKSFQLSISEVRPANLDCHREAQDILKRIEQLGGKECYVVTLAESGKCYDSKKFSSWLFNLISSGSAPLCFVLGGAAGHGDQVIERADQSLSLSPLTFPHKLARLLLIEQLYRAGTIQQGHPYHK